MAIEIKRAKAKRRIILAQLVYIWFVINIMSIMDYVISFGILFYDSRT